MTVLKYKKTVTQKVEKTIPDFYPYDDTPLGKVVDCLLRHHLCRGETVRERLWGDDADVIERAINQLDEAYTQATAICAILGVKT